MDRGDQDRALEVVDRDLGELRIVVGGAGDLGVLAEITSWAANVRGDSLEVGGGFWEPADGDAVLLEAATGDDSALRAGRCWSGPGTGGTARDDRRPCAGACWKRIKAGP